MKHYSTRLLMTCAAIGVAGAVLFTVNAWVGGTVANLVPFLYGLTIGLYFVPGALAQALIQRGGVGLLTTAFAGLAASPFQPLFFGAFLISLAIGALQEIPFLTGRYRHWRTWIFLVGSIVSGLIMCGASIRLLDGEQTSLLGQIVIIGATAVSPPLFTMLAVWLSRSLARAGVGRDLRRTEERKA